MLNLKNLSAAVHGPMLCISALNIFIDMVQKFKGKSTDNTHSFEFVMFFFKPQQFSVNVDVLRHHGENLGLEEHYNFGVKFEFLILTWCNVPNMV